MLFQFMLGKKLLVGMKLTRLRQDKSSAGQLPLPWGRCQVSKSVNPEVHNLAYAFILANSAEKGLSFGLL